MKNLKNLKLRKRFTRTLAGLLAFMLLAAVSTAALAAQGDAIIGQNVSETYQDYIGGAFVQGDTLYLQGYSHLFTYKSGDADVTEIPMSGNVSTETEITNIERMFSDGGRIYALQSTRSASGDNYSFERMTLMDAEVSDAGVTFTELRELDWSSMVASYGDSSYVAQINAVSAANGYLMVMGYTDSGDDYLNCVNLETGEVLPVDLKSPQQVATYKDGAFLVESYDYDSRSVKLMSYDPAADALTQLCEFADRDSYLSGIAYSTTGDVLFYLEDGYVKRMRDFDLEGAEAVAELSAGYYSGTSGLLLPGDLYVYCTYEVVFVRSTNPDEMPETRVQVQLNGYSDAVMNGYYDYANTHGNVAIVLDQSYVDDATIIEGMMNRAADTDIFVMSVDSKAYSALFERGYMVDLSGNQALAEAAAAMYPGILERIEKNGELLAIPLEINGWTLGLNRDALERVGISSDQLPDNWPDFLDMLASLEGKVGGDQSVALFDSYTTQENARWMLFNAVMEAYQNYLYKNGQEIGYDTPILRNVLQKLEQLDFAALGLPEEIEEDGEGSVVVTNLAESDIILQTSTGNTIGNFYGGGTPALLAMEQGGEPILPISMTVAFINPFSTQPEVAMDFLQTMFAHISRATSYNLSDAQNEPVRSAYYEESLKSTTELLDKYNEQLATAEPADKPLIEQNIKKLQASMDYMEKYAWEVGPTDIEWYRANAQYLLVQQYNYLYGGDGEEVYNLMSQYVAKTIDLDQFIKGIAQKAQMMALEGN